METLWEIYSKETSKKPGYGDKGTVHSYIDYYAEKFHPYRELNINFLEIGINKGYSTRMWREYFSKASIYAVDIKDRGVEAPGCSLIYNDATEYDTFKNLPDFDIIIDDGSHIFEHQIKTFRLLFKKLKKNGIYVIEDIQDIDKHKTSFLKLHNNVNILDFRKNKNRYDDVIVEIKK